MRSQFIELIVKRFKSTSHAYLVGAEESSVKDAKWLPKEHVTILENDGAGLMEISIPRWLYNEKGFI